MAAMSFIGMMAAIPVSLALFSPNNPVGAESNLGASSQVSAADAGYAQYANAYTQGYLANGGGGSCSEAGVQPGGGYGYGSAGQPQSSAHATSGHGASASAASYHNQQVGETNIIKNHITRNRTTK